MTALARLLDRHHGRSDAPVQPQTCLDIAEGKSDIQPPERVWKTMETIARGTADPPLEITITAPNNDERGQAIKPLSPATYTGCGSASSR